MSEQDAEKLAGVQREPGKALLRSRFLGLRLSLPDDRRQQANHAIRAHAAALLARLAGSGRDMPRTCVGMYRAFRGEADVFSLAGDLRKKGMDTAFPVTHRNPRGLTFHRMEADSPWRTGAYGITEPEESNPVLSGADLTVLLIPGVAFTGDGWRLGYGGGYYDRLLADEAVRAIRVGVAFACQMADELPHEPHDLQMDWIVSEEGVQECQRAR